MKFPAEQTTSMNERGKYIFPVEQTTSMNERIKKWIEMN